MSDLMPSGMEDMGRKYVEHAGGSVTMYDKPWVRSFARLVERLTIPGMTLHYVVRKLHLEKVARESIAGGYSQIIVLGAGFDTLTQRIASDPAASGVTLIEVDHPATQKVKREVLESYALPIDFVECAIGSDDLFTSLARSARFNPESRTLFIAEGLLMYFDPGLVDKLLESIRARMGAGTRIAFTFMESQGGRIAFGGQTRIVDWWLKRRGEPFLWGIMKESLADYLRARGFKMLELVDTERFRQLYLDNRQLALADGDHLCVAEVSDESARTLHS
jgi:methyltransferase (TIGR00027 family)